MARTLSSQPGKRRPKEDRRSLTGPLARNSIALLRCRTGILRFLGISGACRAAPRAVAGDNRRGGSLLFLVQFLDLPPEGRPVHHTGYVEDLRNFLPTKSSAIRAIHDTTLMRSCVRLDFSKIRLANYERRVPTNSIKNHGCPNRPKHVGLFAPFSLA
jgi:hypothetical protein